jgi:methionine aminopeptidase
MIWSSFSFLKVLLWFVWIWIFDVDEWCGCVYRQTGNTYKNVKRKIEKGIAFPTCISVNNTVCHFSPLASDETVLEEGDLIKM